MLINSDSSTMDLCENLSSIPVKNGALDNELCISEEMTTKCLRLSLALKLIINITTSKKK